MSDFWPPFTFDIFERGSTTNRIAQEETAGLHGVKRNTQLVVYADDKKSLDKTYIWIT